mgnify:CR=1 FL=1
MAEVEATCGRLAARRITEAELEALVGFYDTPEGRAIAVPADPLLAGPADTDSATVRTTTRLAKYLPSSAFGHKAMAAASGAIGGAFDGCTLPGAEDALVARGVVVVPDFIANAGAAAWAWWLLQGQVGCDPQDSFDRLSAEMRAKVAVLAERWICDRIPMRQSGFAIASSNLHALEGAQIVIP